VIRTIEERDLPAVLALNRASEVETSPLDLPRLKHLLSSATHSKLSVEGAKVNGFLLGFSDDTRHDSLNFVWFKGRFERFLYIDRVVIDREARQRGIATRLYADLEAHVAGLGIPLLTCEVNLAPFNPASFGFHARHGFSQVDTVELPGPARKRVSMQLKRLPQPALTAHCASKARL
jgi:predicted GNAT superfamily acetyltransferase